MDMVIGFRKGTMPMMNEPCFATTPEAVDTLVWDSNCGINLANYLTNRKEKVAVIAKGCDSRNIVTHIIENKIKRDQLTIIGVPCTGMIDKRRITGLVAGEILEVSETEDHHQGQDGRCGDPLRQGRGASAELCAVHPPQPGDR